MSTPYSQIVDVLVTTISAVDNTGIVHGFQRNASDPEVFRKRFTVEDADTGDRIVRSWMVQRESASDVQSANTTNTRVYPFVLRGYMGVQDDKETELTFQQVVNDIMDAFTPQASLGGIIELIRPVQARTITYVEIHGVLCHYAELTLEVQEYITS